MWFRIRLFFSFLIKSTNQHGVHSPFVFNLVTKCFYTKTNANSKLKFISLKSSLLKNNSNIKVTDFGAGSKVFKNNFRKISKITKVAGISNKKAFLLMRLINYLEPQNILEIGTSVGLATSAMSLASKNKSITTLEGCPETAAVATKTFKNFNLATIRLIVGNFEKIVPEICSINKFDFIYFDGNHSKKATLTYFEMCLSTISNNSVFVFDDINYSKEMTEAWTIISQHPKVTVSIDTFFWGIVFFRKEQVKQHFTIRV